MDGWCKSEPVVWFLVAADGGWLSLACGVTEEGKETDVGVVKPAAMMMDGPTGCCSSRLVTVVLLRTVVLCW